MKNFRKTTLLPLVLGAALIGADQGLKSWVEAHYRLLERHPFLGQEWLIIARFNNLGLIGDRFSGIPDGYDDPYLRYFPSLFLALLFLMALFRWKDAKTAERVFLALMICGGGSNLWDHWHSSYVVDSLQVYIFNGTYLPFNLADLGLTIGGIGVVLSLIFEFVNTIRQKTKGPADQAEPF